MTQNMPKIRISVLVPRPFAEPFDYLSPQELAPGTIVRVPFGRQEIYGVVWKRNEKAPAQALKAILEVVDVPPICEASLQFIAWMSDYTLTLPGQILKMVLPVVEAFEDLSKKRALPETRPPHPPHLSAGQQEAADCLRESLDRAQYQTFLLEGVTGSGKTEVYFEAIAHLLERQGQALILLPEIALSAQWLQRFERRFGFRPALWHSAVTEAQRKATFLALLKGEVRVIVGARSALFLPFPDLRLVIVDEEHDGSYKQEEGVIYHGRDMAVARARFSEGTCVLASATPSLETLANVEAGKYTPLLLPARFGEAEMPQVQMVDMRPLKMAAQTWLSPALRGALEETLARGEQAMLFLNRRGYAPLTLCRECGDRQMCPHCSLSLVHHKVQEKLICHHCGHMSPIPPQCPACQEVGTYTAIGPGVERIYEEVQTFLPEARCVLLTSDHLTTPKKIAACVQQIQNHEVDILIGTQIMAKGHHFPLLTLVGVVDGDSTLSGSDFRAAEKSFQLLHQVAGRSGREERRGKVLLQTFLPDHPLMQALVAQDRENFFALEAEQRQLHGFPPYGRLVAVILSGKNEGEVEKTARLLARTFPLHGKAELLGPTPAPLSYLRGKYRWRLLVKTEKGMAPQPLLRHWLLTRPPPVSVRVQIDVDPYSFF